jgi:SAM-dependent MidA family methyltransferase
MQNTTRFEIQDWGLAYFQGGNPCLHLHSPPAATSVRTTMSTLLSAIIRSEIASRGPLPFRDFMEFALYHPVHGYYSGNRAQTGRQGDFFTNVSVGALFGKLVAREFAEIWRRLGRPEEFTMVEQGAHDGQFAADALGELQTFDPACFRAARYLIVEPLEARRALQRERLGALPVRWHASLDDLAPFTGIHFSNELLDAFPVHVMRWTGREWCERCVAANGDAFAWTDRPLSSPDLAAACGKIPQPLPEGYTTEVNLAAPAWVRTVAPKLQRGALLIVDYGFPREEYFAPERVEGTLSAYAQHQREPDPLGCPGEIDLTAHVEFTSVIEAAETDGLRVTEFTDQHHWMVRLGASYFAEGAHANERRAFMTLMHPQFMGRAFKMLRLER